MNQRQINAFRLVMRHGSITAAANALNVSQPAVSRLIADLEKSIGFTLFDRSGGRSHPTAEALEFIQEVERMFYGFDRLTQVAREIKDLRYATLRIATMPAVSFELVPQLLSDFLAAHAGIKITQDVHDSARIADLVSARQIDLGLAQIHTTRRDVEILASYRMHCVCAFAPGHRLGDQAKATPAELAGEPIVLLAHHTVTADYLSRCFAEANVQPLIAVESQPSYAACGLSAVGAGVTIVDPLTPAVFGPDRLRTVPFEPDIPFDFHLIKPVDTPLSRAALEFCRRTTSILDETSLIHRLET